MPAIAPKYDQLLSWFTFLPVKLRGYAILSLFFIIPNFVLAEGSKELTSNGGNRAYLLSTTTANQSYPFPTLGTMKVYAKVGETICVGSSAQGFGYGTINLKAPDGSVYTSGTSATVGLIGNRGQELAGPLPNTGGYQPYTRTVSQGQQGIWEIDFISPSNGVDEGFNPTPVAANANWTQPYNDYITAFDVSVRNAGNTAFLTGRVFTNIFCGILGSFNVGFNGILYILTKDGYQYTLNNNGQAGNGFSFFANNKGFRNANGTPSYQSVNSTTNTDVQDPTTGDTRSDITHKIFFNAPAADLPATASTPGGGTTWLISPPFVPAISNFGFTGAEGTVGQAGTYPLGGYFNFTSDANGSYTITIDLNRNGIFTDPVDRKLTGTVNTGNNRINWDGLDGLGNKVPPNTGGYNVNISVSLYSAEVHFPFFDVERNVNGILLTRINGDNAPDYTLYWDDSPITVVGTPSNPVKNLSGISSLVNGHKWGKPTNNPDDENDFGNNKSIDSWTYVIGAPITASVNFKLLQADLEVVDMTSNNGCSGQKVNYTVDVKNNGPDDVDGAVFSLNFPGQVKDISVKSAAVQDTSVVTAAVTSTNQYNATLNMTNGAERRFTISGTVVTAPPGGELIATASILRPADVTDPDATNPSDTIAPADPQAECDALPSGMGCNNIKTDTAIFITAPNAGPDQTVAVNTQATLVANTTGVWSQAGNTPALANIQTPSGATTVINGLTAVGTYRFVYTNANGCADTVVVNVVTPTISIPNIFTPNGDGKNDVFEIKGLSLYPDSRLLIFNRWGNEVYRSDDYQNNWDGSGLADGTYFYILNRKEASGNFTTFKGWVYLKR